MPLALALAAALALATIADALFGPRAAQLHIEREPAEHFALGVAAQLAYAVENRSRGAVRVGIVETPVRTLRFDADEVVVAVAPGRRATVARPVTPVARGADALQHALRLVRERRSA